MNSCRVLFAHCAVLQWFTQVQFYNCLHVLFYSSLHRCDFTVVYSCSFTVLYTCVILQLCTYYVWVLICLVALVVFYGCVFASEKSVCGILLTLISDISCCVFNFWWTVFIHILFWCSLHMWYYNFMFYFAAVYIYDIIILCFIFRRMNFSFTKFFGYI